MTTRHKKNVVFSNRFVEFGDRNRMRKQIESFTIMHKLLGGGSEEVALEGSKGGLDIDLLGL